MVLGILPSETQSCYIVEMLTYPQVLSKHENIGVREATFEMKPQHAYVTAKHDESQAPSIFVIPVCVMSNNSPPGLIHVSDLFSCSRFTVLHLLNQVTQFLFRSDICDF